MPTSVLLSIKPEFAERILNGSKRFEFRRRIFKNRDVNKVIVYATAPVSKVIGEFEIAEIIQADIDELWEQTREYSGIAHQYFELYFKGLDKGYAIKIGDTRIYEKPLSLQDDLQVKHPPQFFIYMSA